MSLRDHTLETIARLQDLDLAGRVRGRTPAVGARGPRLFYLLLSVRDIVVPEQAWLREQQLPPDEASRVVLEQYRFALALVEVRINAAILYYPDHNVRAVRRSGTAAAALVELRSALEAMPG